MFTTLFSAIPTFFQTPSTLQLSFAMPFFSFQLPLLTVNSGSFQTSDATFYNPFAPWVAESHSSWRPLGTGSHIRLQVINGTVTTDGGVGVLQKLVWLESKWAVFRVAVDPVILPSSFFLIIPIWWTYHLFPQNPPLVEQMFNDSI